jgi:hypothetical protein
MPAPDQSSTARTMKAEICHRKEPIVAIDACCSNLPSERCVGSKEGLERAWQNLHRILRKSQSGSSVWAV